jgi:hypothetical protein
MKPNAKAGFPGTVKSLQDRLLSILENPEIEHSSVINYGLVKAR